LESDYPSDADGAAIPYGVYDTIHNEGFVVVETSHQTSEFAVAYIRRWWRREWQSPVDMEFSVLNHGMLLDQELALVWKELTGQELRSCTWLWMFEYS
jgi:hypothetical protein